MIDLLRVRELPKNDLTQDLSTKDMKVVTGLSRANFEELAESCPSLLIKYRNNKTLARNALFAYLMRLRTGETLDQISSSIKVPCTTIQRWIKTVREVLTEGFLPDNMKSAWTRDELIRNTTDLSRALYLDGNANRIAIVLDATYLFIEKSGNQTFQKVTYTDQKKRHFVKVMMCVTTNGKIVFTSGPHPAVDNDAKIITRILSKNECPVFSILEAGDVCLVDRGFRDCAQILRNKELDVRMPEMIRKNPDGTMKKQLSVQQANNSRCVTKCRYVVETRNGHMKCVWRFF